MAGTSRARAIADQIEAVAGADQRDRRCGPDARSPWRSRRHEARVSGGMCGASAAASSRVSACASRTGRRAGAGDDAQDRIVGARDEAVMLRHLAQSLRRASCARASCAEPARARRECSALRSATARRRSPTSAPHADEARAAAAAAAGAGFASPAKRIRKLGAARDMRGHPPSPVLRAAGGNEPFCQRERGVDAPRSRALRVRVARRRRARSSPPVDAALDADIGRTPARARARRRNRRQSRIFRADRAVAPRARARVPPQANGYRRPRARTARPGCCAALPTSHPHRSGRAARAPRSAAHGSASLTPRICRLARPVRSISPLP